LNDFEKMNSTTFTVIGDPTKVQGTRVYYSKIRSPKGVIYSLKDDVLMTNVSN